MSSVHYATVLRESYGRLTASDEVTDAFLSDFYRLFLAKGDAIRRRFANTDMKRQRSMLRRSIQHMLAFSVTLTADEYLTAIAERHGRAGLDITSDLYPLWVDALVKAVRLRDPLWTGDVETAWRIGMAAGIEFMKSRYGGQVPGG